MKKAIFLSLLFIIVQLVIASLLTLSLPLFHIKNNSDLYYWALGITLFLANALMILFTYFILKKADKNPFSNYLKIPSASNLILVILTFLGFTFSINCLSEALDLPNLIESQMEGLMHNALCIFVITILGPIAEEVVFRRGVLGALLESPKYHRFALFISAAIFSLVHMNPAQMLVAFLLGIFLGWLFMRTHSLVLPIICHILNNSISIILGLIYSEDAKIVDLFDNSIVYIITIVVVVVLTIGLFVLLHRILPNEKFTIPEDTNVV